MSRPSSSSAGDVIAAALERARAEGTSQIGEEHLFAALVADPGSRAMLGCVDTSEHADAVWSYVREARRRGGLTVAECQALARLGVDLDEVVRQAEARLGAGALDMSATSARRNRRVSMSPAAVAVLNAAQQQRAARGDRRTTATHLVLGLLGQPGLFADALAAQGITLATARAALDGDDPHAAA